MVINFIDKLNELEVQKKTAGALTYKQVKRRKKLLEWHRRYEIEEFVSYMFNATRYR